MILQSVEPIFKMLVRDFVNRQLYDKAAGYFAARVGIHRLSAPIDFQSFRGQYEYLARVDALYEANEAGQESWHTPAEILRPFYGRAIARCALEALDRKDLGVGGLTIVEAGGGNGTLMRTILDHLREDTEAVYDRTSYHCVDISDAMLGRQRQQASDGGHSDRVHFHHSSFLTWDGVKRGLLKQPGQAVVVLATEVLDNLAHDKVVYGQDGSCFETRVRVEPSGHMHEEFLPVQDPLVLDCLAHMPRPTLAAASSPSSWFGRLFARAVPAAKEAFVPTGALQFLRAVQQIAPDRLILADFHSLPDTIDQVSRSGSRVPNAPVVQRRSPSGGSGSVACSTYLVPMGHYDIFFPTDFGWLQRVHNARPHQLAPQVLNQPDFLRRFLSPQDLLLGQTRSGFNPLLEDYLNVSFFMT